MSGFEGSVDVDDNGIPRKIRTVLSRTLRESGDKFQTIGRRAGQNKIAAEERYFTSELIRSFESSNAYVGDDDRKITVTNYSEYAETVDEGRTPGKKGPPVAALIPWVKAHWGDDFDWSELDNDGGGSGSGSGVPATTGWVNKTRSNTADDYYINQQIEFKIDSNSEVQTGNVVDWNDDTIAVEFTNSQGNVVKRLFGYNSNKIKNVTEFGDLKVVDQKDIAKSRWKQYDEDTSAGPSEKNTSYNQPDFKVKNGFANVVDKIVDRAKTSSARLELARGAEKIDNLLMIDAPGNWLNARVNYSNSQYIQGSNLNFMFEEKWRVKTKTDAFFSTQAHEMRHVADIGSGYFHSESHQAPGGEDSPVPYHFDISNGIGSKKGVHPQLNLLFLHNRNKNSHSSTLQSDTDPVGWDKIIDETENYVKNEMPGDGKHWKPDESRWFEPGDSQIKKADEIVFADGESPKRITITNSTPKNVFNSDNSLWVGVDTQGGTYEFEVDENGNLVQDNLDARLINQDLSEVNQLSDEEAKELFETDIDKNPRKAWAEAVNRAFYTQLVTRQVEKNNPKRDDDSETMSTMIRDDFYSMWSASETSALFFELMNSSQKKWVSRVKKVARNHPQLVYIYLQQYEPSPEVKQKLKDIGYEF